MTTLLLLVLVVLALAVAIVFILRMGRRRSRAAVPAVPGLADAAANTDGDNPPPVDKRSPVAKYAKQREAVLKMRAQASKLPAPGLLVELVKRAGLHDECERADVGTLVSVSDLARMKLMTMSIFVVLGLVLGFLLGNPALLVLFAVALAAIGYFAPDNSIKRAADTRQAHISRAVPLAMEVIGMAVERSSIDAGLASYCRYFRQEILAQELQYVMDRVDRLKEKLDTAMGDLLRKNRNEDLAFLVAAVGQASQMGGQDLREMLENQSSELRVKREQEIKARSLRAPVQMTFPTLFNVLALLLVLGAMAFMQISAGKH